MFHQHDYSHNVYYIFYNRHFAFFQKAAKAGLEQKVAIKLGSLTAIGIGIIAALKIIS